MAKTTKEELACMREDIRDLRGDVKCLTEALTGSPENPEYVGMNERIRLLETKWSTVSRVVWIALASAVGGLVTIALNIFK